MPAPYFTYIYHVAHDSHSNHDDHDYPSKTFPDYNGYDED
jgi:hypothetical protein